ncbi:MAG TPA: nucleoside hydrolase [Xanthobacteraceae bacterium]|nr:nucleoside hydrolase [Xanthobacteraceae bacterium]
MTCVRPIIIDTDPGQDDAIAIMLAVASPDELDIRGIVAVAGNIELAHTQENARKICQLADPENKLSLKVYAGCAKPLARDLVTSRGFHGPTGLGGLTLPAPQLPLQQQSGVGFLVETLRSAQPRSVTICALGPLTNIASAFSRDPTIAGAVREFVMMGGSYFEGGNVTPVAEFNVHVDPEAAQTVLHVLTSSRTPITMMPLDVTHKALSTPPRIGHFRALGNGCGTATADLLAATGYDLSKRGWSGAPLHDPCVVAYLLEPGMFRGRDVNVEIATADPLTLGMTVVDWRGVTGRPPNVNYMTEVEADAYYRLLTERIARLP